MIGNSPGNFNVNGGNALAVSNLRQRAKAKPKMESNQAIKTAIWVYFMLVIFEGALRKWILPGLATPLLVVRDPVAIYILVMAWQRKLLPSNPGLIWITLIAILGVLTAVAVGHGSLLVAIYGARILVLHFPMIFIVGNVFTRDDVVKMGKAILWISIPMTVLIALQFYSPQSALVNRGVGDDIAGAGFNGGALGYFRPPGTFSFTTGNTQFYSVVTCFVFYFLITPKEINRLLIIASTGCLLAAVPLSISRSMFFQIILTGIFVLIATARKSKYIFRVIFGAVIITFALYSLSQYSFFQTATTVFETRLTIANNSRGGIENTLVGYYLGSSFSAITSAFSDATPALGVGIGYGTNVGSIYLNGKRGFFLSEGEWGRLIGELGPLMGLIVIFVRINLTLKVAVASYKKLATGDTLPWILLSIGAVILAQGNWAQPTALGFFVIVGGLMMASIAKPAANALAAKTI